MIRINDATPMYTGLFVTSDRFLEDQTDNGIIVYNKGDVSPFQTVFRVGPYVKCVKEGDYVKMNFARYVRKKYNDDDLRSDMPVKNDIQLFIPEVEINGRKYFHIEENDVMMVITDHSETPNEAVDRHGIITLENHGLIV